MPLPLLRQLTLASLITLALTACGGSDSDSGPSPTPASSSAGQSSSSVASSSSVGQSSSAASSSSAPADVEPAEFSFEPQTGVGRGATVTSNAITVDDIDAPASISVSGGRYSINGDSSYTESAGEVEEGDSVTVQLTAPEDFSTEASATLTIGGVSGTFTVTTEAEDTTPESFGFAPQEGLDPETEVVSEPVTISGINTPVAISIDGGEYQIDSGAFTAEAGELSAGSTLTLRTNTPQGLEQTQKVTVFVGTEQALWAVTTAPDEQAPTADIAFPPPMSATGADTLTVRGRAADELSGVMEVTLTVHQGEGAVTYPLEADEETGFAEWQQSIDLAPGENRVSVQVRDDAGNELEEPVEVTVVHQDYTAPFPNDEERQFRMDDMVYDQSRNRLLLLGSDRNPDATERRLALSVDLKTGERSVFATNGGGNDSLDLLILNTGTLNSEKNRLVATDSAMSEIFEFDLETGAGTVLIEGEVEDSEVVFDRPDDIVKSTTEADSFYIAAAERYGNPIRLIKVNAATGDREVISGPNVGEGPEILGAQEVVVTKDEKTAYVSRGSPLYEIDLLTGNRQEIPLDYSSDSFKSALGIMLAGKDEALHIFEISKGLLKRLPENGGWSTVHPYDESDAFDSRRSNGAHYVEEDGYFFVVQNALKAVYAYDLQTNEFVIVTRYSE